MSRLLRLLPLAAILAVLGACAQSGPRDPFLASEPPAAQAPLAGPVQETVIPAAPADLVPVPPAELVAASTMPEISFGDDIEPPDPLAIKAVPAVQERRAAGTEIGYILLDLESGQALAEMNPDLSLIPASTAKLATALVALEALGPEHRYRTDLLTTAPLDGPTLAGDLVLRGDGNPSLDVADLLDLVVQLRLAGIDRVAGRFLIDDGALPRLREIEPAQPLEAAYNPSIGALSVAFNRVRLAWRGGVGASSATIPPLEEARFELVPPGLLPPGGVELKAVEPQTVVWRVADRGGRNVAALPVKDPGLHTGNVFRWLAAAQGIELPHPERIWRTPFEAQVIAVHESAPLRHLLRDMLVYSNNMMAETIGLSAVQRLGGAETLDGAGQVLLTALRRMMPEVDWRSADLGNHSGLDGDARLTPRQLAAIVRYGWRTGALPTLLPAGGWSGTLAHRFDEPDQALRVWAKTGTLNYGSALAGYLLPESGRPAIFVTMVSDLGARAAYDRLDRPSRQDNAKAAGWNARASALQDDLVEGWLEPLADS